MADKCRIEIIDGDAIRVHGAEAMDAEGRAAFAQLVRAVKVKFAASNDVPNLALNPKTPEEPDPAA